MSAEAARTRGSRFSWRGNICILPFVVSGGTAGGRALIYWAPERFPLLGERQKVLNLRLVGRTPASQKKSLYIRVRSDANGADSIRGDVEALHFGRIIGAVLCPDGNEDALVKFEDGLCEDLALRAAPAEIDRALT